MIRRFLKFTLVGWAGILVQLAVLAALVSGLRMNYLLATALAVETAVLHNFFWHERFTWADRPGTSRLTRILRFNLSTGAVSIVSNVVLMAFFKGLLRVPYLAANLLAIVTASILNFVLADRFVFSTSSRSNRGKSRQPSLAGAAASPRSRTPS